MECRGSEHDVTCYGVQQHPVQVMHVAGHNYMFGVQVQIVLTSLSISCRTCCFPCTPVPGMQATLASQEAYWLAVLAHFGFWLAQGHQPLFASCYPTDADTGFVQVHPL